MPTVSPALPYESLIHKATLYGELDTISDLIEERKINPELPDHVRITL